ncbi:hypothetical protein EKO24_003270 [Candidatus Methylobacter oryzae]|uniref:DUF2029 domain-containing protein n=1 Tax=Candidatus Methylobacter oryzae TaxID=2497749 RepID=A0ABY3CF95_9GAMM|nr:hypothetical protein EKO24_003270 [Candidatus Methylobacter oryzae]
MTKLNAQTKSYAVVGTLSLQLPSGWILQKYLGLAGVTCYFVISSLILFFVTRHILLRGFPKISEAKAILLLALTFFVICSGFSIMYPLANSGVFGPGSDCDDALNIAVAELMQGHYPYYVKTYFNNPISPLPGALLLAIPFVLLGTSAYQNIFWLFVFLLTIKPYLNSWRSCLFFLWATLFLSPAVLFHVFVGNDYLSNSLYILVFSLWMICAVTESGHKESTKLITACLLGIGLSSRANFVLILPLIFSALAQNAGWKPAVKYTCISCAVFILITAPFYFYDPAGFSPLHTINKIKRFRSLLPYSDIVISLTTGLTAVALGYYQSVATGSAIFFRNCAIVLLIPVLASLVLSSLASGKVTLHFAGYGAFFLFFGVLAFWKEIFSPDVHHGIQTEQSQLS